MRSDFPRPDLDTLRFQPLVDDAKRALPRTCPTWSDHNVSDPGITLLEACAQRTDELSYRTGRLTPARRTALLRLAGITPTPAPSARTRLHFTRTDTSSELTVPAGTRVTTADHTVVFATTHPLTLPPGTATGTAEAIHQPSVVTEDLGTSTGTPGQRFTPTHRPQLNHPPGQLPAAALNVQVTTETGTRTWQQVPTFADTANGSPSYLWDTTAGQVRFAPTTPTPTGPRPHGATPPKGARITATYHPGGGPTGNLPSHTLTTILHIPASPIPPIFPFPPTPIPPIDTIPPGIQAAATAFGPIDAAQMDISGPSFEIYSGDQIHSFLADDPLYHSSYPINNNLPDLPERFCRNLDAVTICPDDLTLLLFKGDHCCLAGWMDADGNLGNREPTLISDKFPDLEAEFTTDLDAVTTYNFRGGNEGFYFFRGGRACFYKTNKNPVRGDNSPFRGTTRVGSIKDFFPNLPAPFTAGIDAVMATNYCRAYYFFKDKKVAVCISPTPAEAAPLPGTTLSVTNPEAATGGGEDETLTEAVQRVALGLGELHRAVTAADHERTLTAGVPGLARACARPAGVLPSGLAAPLCPQRVRALVTLDSTLHLVYDRPGETPTPMLAPCMPAQDYRPHMPGLPLTDNFAFPASGVTPAFDTAFTWGRNNAAYFFQDGYCWKAGTDTARPLTDCWHNLPPAFQQKWDAAASYPAGKATYIFRGEHYLLYDDEQDRAAWPAARIKDGFPGLPPSFHTGLDAALILDGRLYAFKDGRSAAIPLPGVSPLPPPLRINVVPTLTGPPGQRLAPDTLTPLPKPLEEAARRHLEGVRLLGARATLTAPPYHPFSIAARLRTWPGQEDCSATIMAAAKEALYRFFHPLAGGPDHTGWPFGRPVHAGDAYRVLEQIPGIRTVDTLTLTTPPSFLPGPQSGDTAPLPSPTTPDRDRVLLDSDGLPLLDQVTLHLQPTSPPARLLHPLDEGR
ncbi:baseplate J/gp47 family protein [Streptomyces yunnanensis]|uniref:Baseplate assembly protein n=1 Tax=Streptomyces yunnanensis TaxID=156453 RepID=A0A9X8N9K2_9ACTN|nr:hypothetical protein [Streptomyces yunnanensis]SHN34104.1 putative baseplate assembly protein [Streptomyces yunnanensis]